MRELINCIAATAAWTEFCTANRILDSQYERECAVVETVLRGSAYQMARAMAMTLELMIQEQARREQPRIVRLPVNDDLGKNLARLREGGE